MRNTWVVFRVHGDQCVEVRQHLSSDQSQQEAEKLTAETGIHHWSVEAPDAIAWAAELPADHQIASAAMLATTDAAAVTQSVPRSSG